MIFLALTQAGFADAIRDALSTKAIIWVNADIVSPTDLGELRSQGIDITNFTRAIDPTSEPAIHQALDTINQHHPGQIVWIDRGAVA